MFGDPLSLTVPDIEHSEVEERHFTIGLAATGKLIVVSHTDRGDITRIISARLATPREERSYEQET